MKSISAKQEDAGKRLDIFLSDHLKDMTRSHIKNKIENGEILVNKEKKKTSYKIKENDKIDISLTPPKKLSAEPQNISIDILYEDKDIVVVNKSPEMVVHPAAGNPDNTLVNALLYHCKDLSGIGGVLRPGIVHRLDKGTSGVIIVAKNDHSHQELSKQFKERTTEKIYYALIYGVPKKKNGVFKSEIGRHSTDRKKMSTKTRKGRDAVTEWEVLEAFGKELSFVRIRLHTGRTHQIRVHFAANGMPLVGDMLYGGKKTVKRLLNEKYKEIVLGAERALLHAGSLAIIHPRTQKKLLFEADLAPDFKSILEAIRNA